MHLKDFLALKKGDKVWWRNPKDYSERIELVVGDGVAACVPELAAEVMATDGNKYTGELKDFFAKKPPRLFYRHILMLEILSETPYEDDDYDIESIAYHVTDGEDSGDLTVVTSNQVITGKKMAERLRNQGSDPSFFRLDADGNDTEEET